MEGYLIDPVTQKATWVKDVRPETVVGTTLMTFKLSNGDTLFHGLEGTGWTLVEGRRVEGTAFLVGGRTTPEEFKEKFSFGFVVERKKSNNLYKKSPNQSR